MGNLCSKEESVRLHESDVAEHSQKNDDSTGEVGEPKPVLTENQKKGKFIKGRSGSKVKLAENISEENIEMKQYQKQTEELLNKLNLLKKHKQKFSPAEFLKIGPPVKRGHNTSEKDLAHTFLQTLMMLDYRARYVTVKNSDVSCSKPFPMLGNSFGALFGKSANSDKTKNTVHPMDVQMAVFHCSDSFFKQNIITKLSQCQYGLPLLVPDPFTMHLECPLWTFRQITRTWKLTEVKDNSKVVSMKSMPICKAETPMVSFFRLNSLPESKSQLMNRLINDRHSTFFHRNSPGSSKSRHLMDGVVEIAWYCPAGKPNDFFNNCIAFCNLHGDAMLFKKQREILIEKSSVNVVLVPTLETHQKNITVIKDLYSSPKPLIILIADDVCGAVKVKKKTYKIGLKGRNQSDVSEELKGIIGKILSRSYTCFKLESIAEVSGVTVDEDDAVCQKGKSAAMKTINILQGMEISEIKDKFLPCQGFLWHEWCRINKEMYHLKGRIEKEKSQKEQQLMKIRQDQCKASCSELMKSFTESLVSLPSKEKEYFLKWAQILIDALSTEDLSSILQTYDKKWTEMLTDKKKHDKSDQLSKQTELEQISKKLHSATFGLEHIFREMGQIYEAHRAVQAESSQTESDWDNYPELAADLMISGHPVELMDGDAGHVPLTWISSLLDEVIKKLGDQRVYVLSVLGLQSSGKSTMLNAMFGLRFAVSAGRCTKGAYMQLVKVSEELKKDFKFSYILVVDTEGLRALELAGNDTLHHDNELATFVVGLGNMTLINIFGENPADMQDVLQIVVQAFMRMKKVELSPSCVFVHQNVTDISAAEKNMDGKRRLQEKLDQMAQLAAKEELCDAECFSDVIGFDVQKDVKYFAQLWEGSPPMAPPNPGYSESIQELKTIILSKAKQSEGIKLSHLQIKINDLWKALMNEQFVFSFKNTLEIAVYRRLEVQYWNWTWALRSNMLIIENELHTRIENGNIDKVEHSDLFKAMSKKYEEVEKDMTKYFDDDRDKEILVHWRGRFEKKIKDFQEELVKGVKKKLDEVIQQKKACIMLNDKKTEFENKLLQKSKELAHQLKDKGIQEDELKKHFDTVWSDWVKELTPDTKRIEDINLEKDQETILRDLGFEWSDITEYDGKRKDISEVANYSDYLLLSKQKDTTGESDHTLLKHLTHVVKKVKDCFWGNFGCDLQDQIILLIKNIKKQSLDRIMEKPVATRGYSITYLQEVAKTVKETVTEFESKNKCAFKKGFTVDLLLYVFDTVGSWLLQSHKKFTLSNDALTYLESKKTHYYNIFRSFCKGNSSAVVFGEIMCEKLKVSIVEAACNQTAIDLAGEMRCTLPAFSGNRLNLEKHLLVSLAQKEHFSDYITYTRNPRKTVEDFIKSTVAMYIFIEHKNNTLNILRKNVENFSKLVQQALFDALNIVKTQRGDIKMLVKEFSRFLSNKLTFDPMSCQNFTDINTFDFLEEEIKKGLSYITNEMMEQLSLDELNESRLRPDQILIEQLCDCCWETCPFCGAVCINTIKEHDDSDHNVPFHRSQGVKGWHYRDTDIMCVEFCTTKVASDGSFHPRHDSEELCLYKKYKTAGKPYADWNITPDESKLKYWSWFVFRFQKELENYYNLKFKGYGEIPNEWKSHTKEQAIKSLDEMSKL